MEKTTSEFLKEFEKYEGSDSFNLGTSLSNLFNNYGLQVAIVIGSILSGIYLIMNGLLVLGIGVPILAALMTYLYTSFLGTRLGASWPPLPEMCPNGYYKDIATSTGATTSCKPITGYPFPDTFTYPNGNFTEACKKASIEHIAWDRCN